MNKRIISLLLSLTLLTGAAFAELAPAKVTDIEREAFYGDISLTELTLPEGTLTIGELAFAYSGLKQMTLPGTITFIADNAFLGCAGLTASAPRGSYAYDYCVSHGYITEHQVSVTHADAVDGVLWLDPASTKGSKVTLQVSADAAWIAELQNLPGTEDWLGLEEVSGSGSGTLQLTVTAVPGTSWTTRDNFATRIILDCGGATASLIVAICKEGPFVNRHLNTGDYARDLIAVAQSQVGYRGGKNQKDLDGTNTDAVHKDWTKYGVFLGINGNPWGAAFISWCAWQAGIPESVLRRTTYARPHEFTPSVKKGRPPVFYFDALTDDQLANYRYLRDYGVKLDRASDWSPQPGDLIFFGWNASNHTRNDGIVVGCQDGVISFIDGNGADDTDTVKLRTIDTTDPYITAFYTPW